MIKSVEILIIFTLQHVIWMNKDKFLGSDELLQKWFKHEVPPFWFFLTAAK